MARYIAEEYADLAVRDLPARPCVLPRHSARCFAQLQKAYLANDKDRVFIRQMLDHIIMHNIARCVGIPSVPRRQLLLAP